MDGDLDSINHNIQDKTISTQSEKKLQHTASSTTTTFSLLMFFFLKIVETASPGKCNMIVKEGDKIHWKYTGTLTDGTVFDSGGYTATIGANQVIKGVDIGIRGMCVGGKRRIVVHSFWAYGAKAYENIPANANLIFDVQLLYIDRPNVAMETYESKLRGKGRVSTENKLKVRGYTFAEL